MKVCTNRTIRRTLRETRETEKLNWSETDRSCILLFALLQPKANTRHSKTSSYAALADTLPLLSIGSKVAYSAVPTVPPPNQAWNQCCHLSLATQQHISKEGRCHPFQKIFAQIGLSVITLPRVSLRFFHWDNSNIPQGPLHCKFHN